MGLHELGWFPPALVSYDCCNLLLKNEWFKITQMYCFGGQKCEMGLSGLKSRYQPGWFLLEALGSSGHIAAF